MEESGIWTRMNVARGRLERALDRYHHGAYLSSIEHNQRPTPIELDRRSDELEAAYVEYRSVVLELLGRA